MKKQPVDKGELIIYKHLDGDLWVTIPGYYGYFANKIRSQQNYKQVTENLQKGKW